MRSKQEAWREPESAAGLTVTTTNVPIPVWTTERRMRHIGKKNRTGYAGPAVRLAA